MLSQALVMDLPSEQVVLQPGYSVCGGVKVMHLPSEQVILQPGVGLVLGLRLSEP